MGKNQNSGMVLRIRQKFRWMTPIPSFGSRETPPT